MKKLAILSGLSLIVTIIVSFSISALLYSCTSGDNENKPMSFSSGLSGKGTSTIVIVNQDGDTLVITKKDTTVTVSKDTSVIVHLTASVTYPVYDTTWYRKGSGGVTPPPDSTVIPPVQPMAIEGFGIDAVGGSNSSTVYHVTNLNASGAGSLANGIGSNKTIVFDVEGTIPARLYVQNVSYLTIDAYTGKKDITVAINQGDVLTVENSHHIIIRGIRFVHNGSAGNDCLNATESSHDVVFDHCSTKGGWDGNIDLAATSGKNFTVQWCMMYNNRGAGNMLITTQTASVHHNLFTANTTGEPSERDPYAHSNYSPPGAGSTPNFDFRNNLITVNGRYASGCGYGSVGNFVNNYYTSTKSGMINLCADPSGCPAGRAYVSGNFNQATATGKTIVTTEFTPAVKYRITTTDAKTAANAVKQSVGTWKRTTEEQNIINAISIP